MLLFLDLCIVILIFLIVLMVLCGFVSLCERKMLALVQLRIGPALFLFGLLTPITDGIKLFLKFVLFVISFDMLFLVGSMFITGFCMFFSWFFLPLGFIIIFDNCFTILFFLGIHVFCNLFSVFFVGCFLFSSCFVYLAAMRTLFFSILSESMMLILYYTIYMLDYFSLFGIKDICINQLFHINGMFLGCFFLGLFWISCLLDSLKLPFDYLECESELVAGLVTELSGIFFVIYSLLEINHLLLMTIIFSSLCCGGLFVCFKSMIMLILGFFVPRAISFRVKITTAQTFILLFLFSCSFLSFNWIAMTKILMLLF